MLLRKIDLFDAYAIRSPFASAERGVGWPLDVVGKAANIASFFIDILKEALECQSTSCKSKFSTIMVSCRFTQLASGVPDLASTSLLCRSRPALNFNDTRMRSAVRIHARGSLHPFHSFSCRHLRPYRYSSEVAALSLHASSSNNHCEACAAPINATRCP